MNSPALSSRRFFRAAAVLALAVLCVAGTVMAQAPKPLRVTIDNAGEGKAISTDLMGVFFEDINDAADGGLYAELIQNRSFEYSQLDNRDWNALTSWTGVGGAKIDIVTDQPIHPNNTHYAVVEGDARVANEGFGGIALKAGEKYDFSIFTRTLQGDARVALVRLETKQGNLIAEADLPAGGAEWQQQKATLTAKSDVADAKLVLVSTGAGRVAFDVVSLFPQKTFKNRPNGMRADLAQAIADLKPKFVRFPGGCVAHGNTLANMYRWPDTIGPVETRKVKNNLWGYQQGYGLGYFEYFQFCEDIGATPLPVVAAGVSCQFAPGGQQAIPMDQMPAYVQEVLDLIEWANGPAHSTWGKKRADAGHPEPFKLKYIGVGNEDAITPAFTERFKMIQDAVAAKCPDIVLIGTSGPFRDGEDFDKGWAFTRAAKLPMIDEHYYVPPQWLLENTTRYDGYARDAVDVYLGEYAAHDINRGRTLRAALSEAAFLTGLERNADVVKFASYAPLLGKLGRTRWDPNLIYFDNRRVVPTISYEVQKLFGTTAGDRYFATTVETPVREPISGAQIGLGTWSTQAEFDDVKLTRGGKTLLQENFRPRGRLDDWRGSGRWDVTADGAYRQTSGDQPALSRITKQLPAGDYVFSVRARKTGGGEGFLIAFGGVDDENHYWWNIGGWGNTQHALEKMTNGGKNPVGAAIRGRIETGKWYDIRIEKTGDRVRCFLDDKLVHEFFDTGFRPANQLFASSVRDAVTGELVVKIVNVGPDAQPLDLDLGQAVEKAGTKTVLAGKPSDVNDAENTPVRVVTSPLTAGKALKYEAPAHSLTVLRLKTAQ